MCGKGKWGKALCLLLVCLLGMSLPAGAVSVDLGAVYAVETDAIEGWPQGPSLYAETAVLMDAETGTVLYNKGMNEYRYPASITKIMTALLAIENAALDETVTFTETMLADQTADSGNAGMLVGEELTMEECLLVMMIKSANDVATQIAEHVGGTVENFVGMMNEKAAALGCTHTHFANASGMPAADHYSSAYDMALIFQAALQNETFRQVIQTPSVSIGPTNLNAEVKSYYTHHPLFAEGTAEHYDGCIGGKTGTTQEAGSTLVTGVERDGMTLIAVTMKAEDISKSSQDQIQLFDYGFQQFKKESVSGINVVIPLAASVSDLTAGETADGETVLTSYYYQGYCVGSGIIDTAVETPEPTKTAQDSASGQEEAAQEETADDAQEETAESEEADAGTLRTMHMIIAVLLALVGVSLLLLVVSAAAGRKRRKRRKRRKK